MSVKPWRSASRRDLSLGIYRFAAIKAGALEYHIQLKRQHLSLFLMTDADGIKATDLQQACGQIPN
jgi:hypothetical protein